jgi:antirestriction protein ArdC
VLSHEAIHWTSHVSRCDRQLGKRFGDDAYAVEELIAELGSAFTMARLELELTPREDHAEYLQSWLKVLKADKKAIFTAASKAQQAADWLVQQSTNSVQTAEVAA